MEQLTMLLNFIQREFGITVAADRIKGWEQELTSGGGRDVQALRADILKHVVGIDKITQWVKSQFKNGVTDERAAKLAQELMGNKGRTFDQMKNDIAKAENRPAAATGPEGDPENKLVVMGGEKQWYKLPNGKWAVAYRLPQGNAWAVFEATEAQMDQIFGSGVRPTATTASSLNAVISKKGYYYSGDVVAVAGEGNFQKHVADVIAIALDEEGLPEWAAKDAEILNLVYLAQAQQKDDDWLQQQISKTKAFKERYQGIDELYAQGLDVGEAVQAYQQYESQVNSLYKRYGYDRDVTAKDMKVLLEKGHSIDDVNFVFGAFDRMNKNKDAFKAFNQILVASGQKPLKAADMMKFITGNAPAELYQLWESSQVQMYAQQAGLGNYINAQEAIRLAEKTAGIEDERTIAQNLQQAAALALRYRAQIDVTKYGLTADDIIDMSMGLAPRSGKSEAELTNVMQRISSEAEAFLGRAGATPYIGFTPEGRPQAASLSGFRQKS